MTLVAAGHSVADDVLIAAVGPAVTIVFGTVVAGVVLSRLSQKRTDRMASLAVRVGLITEMTRVANALHTQLRFHANATATERQAARAALDAAFRTAMVESSVLERRLAIYLREPTASDHFHGSIDCLTVEYYRQLEPSEAVMTTLYEKNAKGKDGLQHSGLSVADLRDEPKVYARFKQLLTLAGELTMTGSWVDWADAKGIPPQELP